MTPTLPLYNTDPWPPCVPPLTVQQGAGLKTLAAQIVHVTEIKGHLLDRGSFQSVLIRDLQVEVAVSTVPSRVPSIHLPRGERGLRPEAW